MWTNMGSYMAPARASLFMAKFEMDFLNTCDKKPTLSYLDDIFLLWDNSLNDLQLFVDSINTYHLFSFLDVLIKMMIWQYRQTYISKKQTPINIWTIHRFTQNSVKTEFPTAKLRRILYNDDCFIESLRVLKQYYIDRGYPENAIKTSFDKVYKMSQENTLQQSIKDKTCMLPIVTVHNPSLLNIGATLHKYWDILNLSSKDEVKWLHENLIKPMLAYKRTKYTHDHLIGAKYDETIFMSDSCNRSRCSHCKSVKHK